MTHRVARALLAIVLAGGGATAAFAESLQDENLLVPVPTGFVSGYQASNTKESMAEYVPDGETVNDWSKMVTVQIYHGALVDVDDFAGRIGTGWSSACPGGQAEKRADLSENGYPATIWSFACPLNPETGKPERMLLKAILGSDALYSVQYAYKALPSAADDAPGTAFLTTVSACDTRRTDRPCPGM